MDELQVYDDLIQLDISKYKERIDELELHINKLNADIQTLCTKMLDMKKSQKSLMTNISALYSTAKNEIQRKDRMIAQLRKEKDDILFRKSCSKRPHSRSRSQSRENKIVRLSIEKDDCNQEKAGNLKQYLAIISEDKVPKNEPFNTQINPEKEQDKRNKTKHKEKQHFDSKKKLIISEYNVSRSKNDVEISKSKHDLVKNLNFKENSKNPKTRYHKREDNSTSKSINDKNSARDAKQSTDLRNKLIPRSKHGAETSKRHKTDFLKERSDKDASKLIKGRYKSVHNKKIVSPIKKLDDHDESILDLSADVKVSDKKISKCAGELKVHLLKRSGSIDRNINGKSSEIEASSKDLMRFEETKRANSDFLDLKPSQFMKDIINDAEGDNIAETKMNEDNIVELHIHKKSDSTINCTAPEEDNDLLLMQFEENAPLVTAKPLENEIASNNEAIQVYQNNENVNTSNSIDLIQTEEKINVTEAPANISSNSSRRRRRAIVFIS